MVTGTPVQSTKEHKKITDEIDDSYMKAVYSATELDAFLVSGTGGSRREVFISFYKSFFGLFSHTRYMPKVDDTQDELSESTEKKKTPPLCKEIQSWFEDCKNPRIAKANFPKDFIVDGLNLFSEYQRKLIKVGVVTISR